MAPRVTIRSGWDSGPHVGRGTASWDEAIGSLYEELAVSVGRGDHQNS